MRIIKRWATWKLLFCKGRLYEIHRLNGLTWNLYKGISADDDDNAIQKTIAIAASADKWLLENRRS